MKTLAFTISIVTTFFILFTLSVTAAPVDFAECTLSVVLLKKGAAQPRAIAFSAATRSIMTDSLTSDASIGTITAILFISNNNMSVSIFDNQIKSEFISAFKDITTFSTQDKFISVDCRPKSAK